MQIPRLCEKCKILITQHAPIRALYLTYTTKNSWTPHSTEYGRKKINAKLQNKEILNIVLNLCEMIKSCEGRSWFDQRNKRMKQLLEWRPFHISQHAFEEHKLYPDFPFDKRLLIYKTRRFQKLNNLTIISFRHLKHRKFFSSFFIFFISSIYNISYNTQL